MGMLLLFVSPWLTQNTGWVYSPTPLHVIHIHSCKSSLALDCLWTCHIFIERTKSDVHSIKIYIVVVMEDIIEQMCLVDITGVYITFITSVKIFFKALFWFEGLSNWLVWFLVPFMGQFSSLSAPHRKASAGCLFWCKENYSNDQTLCSLGNTAVLRKRASYYPEGLEEPNVTIK